MFSVKKEMKNLPVVHHASPSACSPLLVLALLTLCGLPQACIEDDLSWQKPGASTGDSNQSGEDLDTSGDSGGDRSGEDASGQGGGGDDVVVLPDAGPDLWQEGEEDMSTDMDQGDVLPPSRCTELAREITCDYLTTELDVDGISRDVHWQLPAGQPPEEGWPIVVFFQGSFFSSERSWESSEGTLYGGYQLTRTFKALLDEGFAILAPEASFGGSTYWDTNIWPYNYGWESSNDHALMLAIFEEAERGTFGELDTVSWFATGISSGGYMTSRMAIAYPGKFNALSIMSGSYATCAGVVCSVPDAEELPSDHPPTLFLHGSLDATVPLYTMERYAEELDALGIPHREIVDDTAGHEWIPAAVEALPAWFDTYR